MPTSIKEFSEQGSLIAEKKLQNKLPHGTWTIYDSKSRPSMVENYEKGKLHGITTQFENGEKISETAFRFGKKNGPYKEYYSNGGPMVIANYELNRLHGPYTKYRKNGQVEYQGMYVRNKRNSTWKYFDKKGNLTEEITYKLGEIVPKT